MNGFVLFFFFFVFFVLIGSTSARHVPATDMRMGMMARMVAPC